MAYEAWEIATSGGEWSVRWHDVRFLCLEQYCYAIVPSQASNFIDLFVLLLAWRRFKAFRTSSPILLSLRNKSARLQNRSKIFNVSLEGLTSFHTLKASEKKRFETHFAGIFRSPFRQFSAMRELCVADFVLDSSHNFVIRTAGAGMMCIMKSATILMRPCSKSFRSTSTCVRSRVYFIQVISLLMSCFFFYKLLQICFANVP